MCCSSLAKQSALVLKVDVSCGWQNILKKTVSECCCSNCSLKQLDTADKGYSTIDQPTRTLILAVGHCMGKDETDSSSYSSY